MRKYWWESCIAVLGKEKIDDEAYNLGKIFNFDGTGLFQKQVPLSVDVLGTRVWASGYEAAESPGMLLGWAQVLLGIWLCDSLQ